MIVELIINNNEQLTFNNVESVKLEENILTIVHKLHEYLASRMEKYPIDIVKSYYIC